MPRQVLTPVKPAGSPTTGSSASLGLPGTAMLPATLPATSSRAGGSAAAVGSQSSSTSLSKSRKQLQSERLSMLMRFDDALSHSVHNGSVVFTEDELLDYQQVVQDFHPSSRSVMLQLGMISAASSVGLVMAHLLSWMPGTTLWAGPGFALASALFLALTMKLWRHNTNAVGPMFASLAPLAVALLLASGLRWLTSVMLFGAYANTFVQTGSYNMRSQLPKYTGAFVAIYVLCLVTTQETMSVAQRGPDAVLTAEFGFVTVLVLSGVLFTATQTQHQQNTRRLIKDYNRQRLTRMRKDLVRDEIGALRQRCADIDMETPLVKSIKALKTLCADPNTSSTTAEALQMVIKLMQQADVYAPKLRLHGSTDRDGDSDVRRWLSETVNPNKVASPRPSTTRGLAGGNVLYTSSAQPIGSPARRASARSIGLVSAGSAASGGSSATLPRGGADPNGDWKRRLSLNFSQAGLLTQGERPGSLGALSTATGADAADTASVSGAMQPSASGITLSSATAALDDTAATRTMERVTEMIEEMADTLDTWEFDVFRCDRDTGGHPLLFVVMALFEKYGFIQRFQMQKQPLRNFLLHLEANYGNSNPYHTRVHAADVVHAMHWFLLHGLADLLGDIEVFAALLAATIHDYNHPGVNNAFHVASGSELATRYNDRSVLENHHCAAAFSLLQQEQFNFFPQMPREERTTLRSLVIEFVLATDMAQHLDIVGRLEGQADEISAAIAQGTGLSSAQRRLILCVAIKCADVSNPAKPRDLCVKWAELVMEEFRRQGDLERKNNMPVSMWMDRREENREQLLKCQIGFIDFICAPLYTTIHKVLPRSHHALAMIKENRAAWVKAKEEHDAAVAAGQADTSSSAALAPSSPSLSPTAA